MRKFKHYKGGEYEYICEATHSETGEIFVVYRPLYNESGVWIRPKEMFFENVEMEGQIVPRFKEILE
ncbi:DUF1653 domain-containing protein [Synergistaceae bacterium OttesenSCG-928-D05]|nr:DUF1653 domain-containing protein [Synergistaceae bacterium OttesenSCG-928-D05]